MARFPAVLHTACVLKFSPESEGFSSNPRGGHWILSIKEIALKGQNKMNFSQQDRKLKSYIALLILAIFTVAMFADVLFFSDNLILSKNGTDITQQFFYWRDFGFSQLKNGNLALWNPHIFSGTPFLGGFQSALLYPPNILYVILPLSKAINISIALHVLLIGFFMYLWTTYRGLHPLACLCSSIILMFSGAYFLHIYAGHLSNLCTMAWVPLLFLCIDRLFAQLSLKWSLIGIFTITMLILAGHPQYVYYTALAAGAYSALCLIRANHRIRIITSLAVICLGSLLLSAVQILSSIDAAGESARSVGLPYLFAAMFSFPPENIVTLIVPNFFGDMVNMPYWGRCYLWEMSLFISITGFALAIYGAYYGERKIRRFSLIMVIFLFVLALGIHTPFFNILYHWLPGFKNFRGSSKFIFLLTVFLVMLSGIGLDHLIRNKRKNIGASAILLIVGIILFGSSLWIATSVNVVNTSIFWRQILNYIATTHEFSIPLSVYSNPVFMKVSADFTVEALLHSALVCLLLSLLFLATKYHRIFTYFIATVAIVEIFIFAHVSKQVFDIRTLMKSEIKTFLQKHPGDYRILYLANPDSAMSIKANDVWGYDPGVLLRYAQFVHFTQGDNPNKTEEPIVVHKVHHLFKLIRLRYIFIKEKDRIGVIDTKDSMDHINLIYDWQIIDNRNDIFNEMDKPTFNPRKNVILETFPGIIPSNTKHVGVCKIEDMSTDYLTIRGKLAKPAILLITDAYSKGWKAMPLPDSTQQVYRVMPANYAFMAIPLSAGEHHLRLEYKPAAFIVGKWISLFAIIIYLTIILIAVRKPTMLQNYMTIFLNKRKKD
jgi:hypothetical protein